MNLDPPDLATLRAYVSGTLAPEEAEAIRTWLIVSATEEVLEIVGALALAVDQARVRESYWVTHPLRARLARVAWHARSTIGNLLELELGHRVPPVAATLGRESEHLVRVDTGGTVAVRPDLAVELVVTPASAAWCSAYAVDDKGGLLVLPSPPSRHPAGTAVELGAVALESGETLDVFVVFDPAGPLPAPPEDADAAWLVDVLLAESAGRSVISASLVAESTEPGGKQT